MPASFPLNGSGGGLQQQGCEYLAALVGKYVVRAAGGCRVHGFHADAARHQWRQPLRGDKAQATAAAKDDDLAGVLGQGREMLGAEVFEMRAVPGLQQTVGADQHAVLDPEAIDCQPAGAQAGDGLHVHFVGSEFHGQ